MKTIKLSKCLLSLEKREELEQSFNCRLRFTFSGWLMLVDECHEGKAIALFNHMTSQSYLNRKRRSEEISLLGL